ncbi:Putative F0F1-ATPase subunit Ca2+/Mg2+ transporter [Tenuibacillus multivorans]|uniref:Putative F0F1-ATPase subunit Ca2+/Mg2+ transporter n=1 Tax=Tenuibacillus multivorans TaxID=237069 RepID=A0A1G9X3B4_9BACI|nr:AtpZ/AtpI family protein [Tenuibacillus multivorans]SDM90936.1 Putative F0F1-ATPase subunit Ca2+/Mg2+ transporter [Tenuibacillus multivorans]
MVILNKYPLRGIAITTSILSYLSGSTIVGILLGRWLDQYFETSPLFLIIGLLIGLASGVYGMIVLVKKFLGDE